MIYSPDVLNDIATMNCRFCGLPDIARRALKIVRGNKASKDWRIGLTNRQLIKHLKLMIRCFTFKYAILEILKAPRYFRCWLKTRHKEKHIMSMAGVCIITCQKCGKTLEFIESD